LSAAFVFSTSHHFDRRNTRAADSGKKSHFRSPGLGAPCAAEETEAADNGQNAAGGAALLAHRNLLGELSVLGVQLLAGRFE